MDGPSVSVELVPLVPKKADAGEVEDGVSLGGQVDEDPHRKRCVKIRERRG